MDKGTLYSIQVVGDGIVLFVAVVQNAGTLLFTYFRWESVYFNQVIDVVFGTKS